MNHTTNDDVIDLTQSFSFTPVDHCAMANVIIDLDTDDSFYSPVHIDSSPTPIVKLGSKCKSNSQCEDKELKKSENSERNKNTFGECPICWDELGKSPLASTKCGHVYCLKCLERSLQVEKKCPTCRSSLRGKTAYHPLYIFKN